MLETLLPKRAEANFSLLQKEALNRQESLLDKNVARTIGGR